MKLNYVFLKNMDIVASFSNTDVDLQQFARFLIAPEVMYHFFKIDKSDKARLKFLSNSRSLSFSLGKSTIC